MSAFPPAASPPSAPPLLAPASRTSDRLERPCNRRAGISCDAFARCRLRRSSGARPRVTGRRGSSAGSAALLERHARTTANYATAATKAARRNCEHLREPSARTEPRLRTASPIRPPLLRRHASRHNPRRTLVPARPRVRSPHRARPGTSAQADPSPCRERPYRPLIRETRSRPPTTPLAAQRTPSVESIAITSASVESEGTLFESMSKRGASE
jgi:hypothetical protein